MKPTYEIRDAECLHDTGKALKIIAPEFEEPIWVPQSQIDEDSEVYQRGDKGTLIVSQWIAEEKGWV